MAGTYKPSDLPDSDEELEKNPQGTSDADLAEAATFVCGLLAAADVGYAIIGGFGMRIRGSRRPTQDVDIAIEAGTTIAKLQAAVGSSNRIRLPNLPNAVYRILVKVSSGKEVQVDLKLATHAGAPSSLQGIRELREFQGQNFTVLNTLAAFSSKLKVYANRAEDTDLEDLLELVQNFAAEIRPSAQELKELAEFNVFVQALSTARRAAVLNSLGLAE